MSHSSVDALGEFTRSVEEYLFRRLVVADKALELAVAVGAAADGMVSIEIDGTIADIAGVVLEDIETVKGLLMAEARQAGLTVHAEVGSKGRILWDCDLPGAPWGEGRPWSLTDVVEEVALARLSARAGQ